MSSWTVFAYRLFMFDGGPGFAGLVGGEGFAPDFFFDFTVPACVFGTGGGTDGVAKLSGALERPGTAAEESDDVSAVVGGFNGGALTIGARGSTEAAGRAAGVGLGVAADGVLAGGG
jgi:hypothetical protein